MPLQIHAKHQKSSINLILIIPEKPYFGSLLAGKHQKNISPHKNLYLIHYFLPHVC